MRQLQMHSAASLAASSEKARASKGLFVIKARLNNRLVETAAVQPALALQTAITGKSAASKCFKFPTKVISTAPYQHCTRELRTDQQNELVCAVSSNAFLSESVNCAVEHPLAAREGMILDHCAHWRVRT